MCRDEDDVGVVANDDQVLPPWYYLVMENDTQKSTGYQGRGEASRVEPVLCSGNAPKEYTGNSNV